MSDQSTEKVFFEIGVGEDPKAINALEKLAARIEQMQSKMLAGVRDLEQAAKAAEVAAGKAAAAGAAVGGRSGRAPRSAPTTTLPTFGGSNRNTGLPTVPSSLPPDATTPIPSAAPPSSTPSRAPARGRGTSSLPVPYATVPSDGTPSPTVPPNPFSGLNPGSSRPKSSGRGKSKMPVPFSTLPVPGQSPTTPTSLPSATVPSGASGDAGSAGIAPDAIERMDKFAKSSEKAFKGVLDLGRGMALLGLMSEENSQKFLQSLVAIEGVVSTIKGGADLAEGLSGLMRGNAGRAAGAAASAASGAAAGSGGFMATTVGGVAVGAAGTVAAAAAALASVSLVAVELKEIFSGTANQVGSVNDTIATWEVGLVSSLGELTGWFDLVGNAATKEAEAKANLFKIEQERLDSLKAAELDAKRSIEFGQSANNEKYMRFASQTGSGIDSPLQAEVALYADALGKFQQSQKTLAELAAAGAEGTKEYADQVERAAEYSAKIERTQESVVQLEKQAAKEKIDGAQKSIDMARQELDSRMKMLDALQEQRMTAAERFAALDDLQKSEAISALRQAQTQGATSLSDQQRSLLRSVGGDEANRFAREADIAEARAFGFDTSFGVGFDQQTARLESEKAKFQAVIQEQNQIVINVEDRTRQVVENVVKEYARVIQDSNREIERRVKEDAQRRVQQINQNFSDQQRALKQAKG